MSYCRWSSMNGYCDLYIYENADGGWTCHVAARRIKPGAPYVNLDLALVNYTLYKKCIDEYDIWKIEQGDEYDTLEMEEAGKSFNTDTPGEMADLVEKLINKGFVAPLDVVFSLREEEKELEQ